MISTIPQWGTRMRTLKTDPAFRKELLQITRMAVSMRLQIMEPALPEMKTQVRLMGISDNVRFAGWRKDIEEILPMFDIFVLPSLNEGMGRVLVEAMAAAVPIVASDTGGIPDVVRHRENGFLVPPGDPEALAEALLQLMRNPDEADRMGHNGRRLAAGFSVEEMILKIEHLYAELLLNKNLRASIPHATLSGLSNR